ncbi:MAG TPA: septal ring lytic transglycosylase RlpA family protein [Dehalococcoidia bacterium]|nr:septal ring lytic transglycosylase RlpA family protein [Dehalococcoidia bacterium]
MHRQLVAALASAVTVTLISASGTLAGGDTVVQLGGSPQRVSAQVNGGDLSFASIAAASQVPAKTILSLSTGPALPPADAADRAIAAPPAPPAGPESAPAASDAPQGPAIPLPVLSGPASPDAAPAPGSLPETPAPVAGPVIQTGLATWYGPGFNGSITYCGEIYDQWALTAASNTLPCGTVIIVTNRDTGQAVHLRITDRGGFGGSVILDLSRAAFLSIAPASAGVIPVSVALPVP